MKTVSLNSFLFITIFFITISCDSESKTKESKPYLPYYGFHDVDYIEENGEVLTDTIFHVVPKFYFTSHLGTGITNETVKGHIYVADFFFSHCPSICPMMTNNLSTLHERTKDIEELIILSHTIDPGRDSIQRLNEYISLMDINVRDDWFFVRGSQEYTYEIGKYGYLINADVDPAAEGGFLHSEHFVLVDRGGHIRGMYEGTDTNQINILEQDIRKLILIEDEQGN